jgi:hypothetical protein
MPTPMDSSQFARLLDKRMREVSESSSSAWEGKFGVIDKIYSKLSSESAFEEFFQIGDLPDIPAFNGQLTFLSIAPGYYRKIEPKEYAGGVQFERKLLDDKKYPVLDGRAAKLGTSYQRTKQKSASNLIINAASASFDFMYSEEGVALASTAHTTKSGTSTTTGFSNLGSSAMDKTSVAATKLLMRRFKNDISERIGDITPDGLMFPDALGDTAFEIVKTPKSLDTAEGNVNPSYGQYQLIPIMIWDDTDTNNWAMVDTAKMKENCAWVDRIGPDFKTWMDNMTYLTMESVYGRFAYGFKDWRWVYFHAVT